MTKYKTLLADPPWQYRNVRTGGSHRSGAAQHYPVMSIEEICALGPKIRSIADSNSVLLLWATVPLLPEALKVMATWGWTYKTAIFWRKIMSLGMGFWFRGQVELCLLGIRGKIPAFRCQRANIIQTKVGKHSEKPEEFFQLIDPITPTPKLELFARKRRPGWDAWGLDIKDGIELPLF